MALNSKFENTQNSAYYAVVFRYALLEISILSYVKIIDIGVANKDINYILLIGLTMAWRFYRWFAYISR